MEYCWELPEYRAERESAQEVQRLEEQVGSLEQQLEDCDEEEERIGLHREIKHMQRLAGRSKVRDTEGKVTQPKGKQMVGVR